MDMSDDSYKRGVTDATKALGGVDNPDDMDVDAEQEERAADLSNEITDAAKTLMEFHGWTKQDILDHVDMALEDK
jgi:hypothetical protein